MLEVLLVLFLSVVPFIENRGALFVGFAMGVTDPLIYAIGTVLNVLIVPVYLFLFSKYKLLRGLKVGDFLTTKGPMSFALLVPGTANGANALTCSLLASNLSFSFAPSFLFISIGIVFRGLVTFLLLAGVLTFAEAANIGNGLTVVMVLATAFFFLPSLKKFLEKKKGKRPRLPVKKEYLLAALFALLAILSALNADISYLLRSVICLVVAGLSDGKVIAFFAFASLFLFFSGLLKPCRKTFSVFIAAVVLMNLIMISVYFLTLPSGYESEFFHGTVWFVGNDHISINLPNHIHVMKPALVYPLLVSGVELSEDAYDFGLTFLDFLPGELFALQFILLVAGLLCLLFAASSFTTLSSKAAAILGGFTLLKLSVDGGPLNAEFLTACFLMYFALHEPGKFFSWKNLDFWAIFFVSVLVFSAAMNVIHFHDVLSPESLIYAFSFVLTRFSKLVFTIFLLLVLMLYEKSHAHFPLILTSFSVFALFAILFSAGVFSSSQADPVKEGDTVLLTSSSPPPSYAETYEIGGYSLYRLVSPANLDSSRDLLDSSFLKKQLKTYLVVFGEECLLNSTPISKTYLIHGDVQEKRIESEYFTFSISGAEDSELAVLEVSLHPCVPNANILPPSFVARYCDKCVISGDVYWK